MGNQIIFTVGIICLLWLLYRTIKFIYPYIRRSDLRKYQKPGAFAVVTGATDGIGKAIAVALAGKGFNIVLHGRNEAKLQAVKMDLETAYPQCQVVLLLHDGSRESRVNVEEIEHLPVTVLVNNVGIGPMNALADFSAGEIDETITLNMAFPSQLTRSLLPQLGKPGLILNVSSYAGLFPPPYLAVYAGSKAYNNAFSISLARELENVEVISLITGSVNTGTNKKPVTFMRPAAATYAKHVLAIVGCGRKSIMPYWPHAIQTFLISLLPEKLIDSATKNAMQRELQHPEL
ncbi:17beta-estradiol 17-dehydrogenase / very-long-chain 3-oxoacyl-CoA reductase [Chitinophaga sp. W3I9]|uniref:SDR family oxidoreductase n=1 Tax=Chitinophaga sp. W3I9 TaxID=3373924 RepID=UPI003D235D52